MSAIVEPKKMNITKCGFFCVFCFNAKKDNDTVVKITMTNSIGIQIAEIKTFLAKVDSNLPTNSRAYRENRPESISKTLA